MQDAIDVCAHLRIWESQHQEPSARQDRIAHPVVFLLQRLVMLTTV